MSNDSKFIVKGKRSFKDGNSAFLADRALPEKGKKSFKDEPSAFLAERGEPETGSATFNDSRYK